MSKSIFSQIEIRPEDRRIPEKVAVLLLSDMAGYTRRTMHMVPVEVRNFIVEYRLKLESLIMEGEHRAQYFEHTAGDATASMFSRIGEEGENHKCIRALKAALKIIAAVEENQIPRTRIGLYAGPVIETRFKDQTMVFGNSFSAASRLQELCAYFGTNLLMDRDVALAQRDEKKYIVNVGKITPKSLDHPVHIFTVCKPGLNGCPIEVDEKHLLQYIKLKNIAMEVFTGNHLRGINPDYPTTTKLLHKVSVFYKGVTGLEDISTRRVLEYIDDYSYPTDHFLSSGMIIQDKRGNTDRGIRLSRLSQEILKALDQGFYKAFILNTEWEEAFKLEWIKKGEVIIEMDDEPDGFYFLRKGKIHILDDNKKPINILEEGNIFGEFTYLSQGMKKASTVVAATDVILHKISGEDLKKYPTIRRLCRRIVQRKRSWYL